LIPFPDKSPLNMDYEQLYNDLLKKHIDFKVENDKLKGVDESLENYKKINECLRSSMNLLHKSLNSTNSILKTTKKTLSEEVKTLSL